VLFQVLGYFGTGPVHVSGSNEVLNFAISQIWPPQGGDIVWPANNLCFNDETIETFARYWTGPEE
jgi:hypothetical protein